MNNGVKSILQKNGLKKIFAGVPASFAYLFGSYATRTATGKSDVDIAVLFDRPTPKAERFERRLQLMADLSRLLKKNVEVVVLNDVSSLFFKYAIIKEGILLYKKSEAARIEFEDKILGEFFDFQPFLDAYNRHYVKTRLQ